MEGVALPETAIILRLLQGKEASGFWLRATARPGKGQRTRTLCMFTERGQTMHWTMSRRAEVSRSALNTM